MPDVFEWHRLGKDRARRRPHLQLNPRILGTLLHSVSRFVTENFIQILIIACAPETGGIIVCVFHLLHLVLRKKHIEIYRGSSNRACGIVECAPDKTVERIQKSRTHPNPKRQARPGKRKKWLPSRTFGGWR